MTADEYDIVYEFTINAKKTDDEFDIHNRIVDETSIDPASFEESEAILAVIKSIRDNDESINDHRKNFFKYLAETEVKKNG